jgi:FG-GAP-like repeat
MNRTTAFLLLASPLAIGAVALTPSSREAAERTAGAPLFEPVAPELFAAGGTLANAWADYDGDGDPDLFVGFNGSPNRLYRNDAGHFVEVAAEAGIADARPTRAAAWIDIDGDADADLVVGFTPAGGGVLRVYRNAGGRFTDATVQTGLQADSGAVRQISGIDFDADGDVDVFVAFRDRPNALFRNRDGVFTDVAAGIGLADARKTVGAVWFDADSDGDLDLYVANMDGDANGLFLNEGGRFHDGALEAGVNWGGRLPGDAANGTVRPCAADVDNDGQLDLFMANYGPNGLFLNRGGRFTDVSAARGVAVDSRYDSCAFGDYDNDGRIDVYVNGTVTGGVSYRDHLLRNMGDTFEEATPPELAAIDSDHGVQWADFDGDGDLDLALAASGARGPHPLLRNTATGPARGLNVMVLDSAGRPSLAGQLVSAFEAGTRRRIGTRLIDSGSGYDSQSILPVHFGLGRVRRVDLEISLAMGGQTITGMIRDIDAEALRGRTLVLRIDWSGRIIRG